MRLVFQLNKALSLSSLSDFFSTANNICERNYGVTAPQNLTEIRVQTHLRSPRIMGFYFMVTLIGALTDADYEAAEKKWKAIGEGYNWKLKGRLKKNTIFYNDISTSISDDNWEALYIEEE